MCVHINVQEYKCTFSPDFLSREWRHTHPQKNTYLSSSDLKVGSENTHTCAQLLYLLSSSGVDTQSSRHRKEIRPTNRVSRHHILGREGKCWVAKVVTQLPREEESPTGSASQRGHGTAKDAGIKTRSSIEQSPAIWERGAPKSTQASRGERTRLLRIRVGLSNEYICSPRWQGPLYTR